MFARREGGSPRPRQRGFRVGLRTRGWCGKRNRGVVEWHRSGRTTTIPTWEGDAVACGNRPQPVEANTPAVSPDERITELARQLRETRAALEGYKAVTDIRLQTAETRLAE